tara:strand:+ start:1235 stop:1723 length:489 start_codon:yes stop_codon:yes gene_type:complete
MAWSNIHRTIGSNGQVTVNTGYWEETISLLDWRTGQPDDGKRAYTSSIPISTDFSFTVLMTFNNDVTTDVSIKVEHSVDGTNWTTAAQSGTTALSTADFTGGTDISTLAVIDDSAQAENTTGYFFVYDPETHGGSRYIRFGTPDWGNIDCSAYTIKFQIIPH